MTSHRIDGTTTVTNSEPLLEVEDLRTYFDTDDGTVKAVDGVSFSIPAGGILGIVGESGSGKSVTGMTILGLLDSRAARVESGVVRFDGRDLLQLSQKELQALRGSQIGMVFQSALTGLDPALRIESQLVEVIRRHQLVPKARAREIALESLELVAMPEPARRLRSYPHELSGGQRQRVLIAMALACGPDLLIADEPTTALDATVQKQIVDLLADLNRKLGLAIMIITHDFGVVARMCDSVVVMRHGAVVERGTVGDVLNDPQADYTKSLIEAVPRLRLDDAERAIPRGERRLVELGHGDRLPRVNRFARDILVGPDGHTPAERRTADLPMLKATSLRKTYPAKHSPDKTFVAVDDVDLTIYRGETFGLIGESGSGKTTIGRMLLALIEPTAGSIEFEGNEIAALERGSDRIYRRRLRKRMQMVFQDSGSAFNPRRSVGEQIAFGMTTFDLCAKDVARERTNELLARVGLAPQQYDRFPHEFSGGQKQRLGIARALASEPDFLVLDEPTAALDVSVQAQILNLLKDLQRERRLTMLLITHNLSLVEFMCDNAAVLQSGTVVESGPVDSMFTAPKNPMTRELLNAVLEPEAGDKVA